MGASLALLVGGPAVALPQLQVSVWYLGLWILCWFCGWLSLFGSLRPKASVTLGLTLGLALYLVPGLGSAVLLLSAMPALLARPLDLLWGLGAITLMWPVYGLWVTGALGIGPN